MNILVTGGAGYIGSHVANFLVLRGYNVVAYDNLSAGDTRALHSSVQLVRGDILSYDSLSELFARKKFDVVFHLAGKISPRESLRAPCYYYENNVVGTVQVLKACSEHRVRNLVFASSSNVYGESSQQNLLAEDFELKPINSYGASKAMCERIISDMGFEGKIRYKILRFFNVAGGHQNLTNGQRGNCAIHIIHRASQAAFGLFPEIKIFGRDYPTKDGTCVRDYIHIDDLVDLQFLCMQDLLQNGDSEILNCGYGDGFSVREICETVLDVAPIPFRISYADRRPGDAAVLVASTEKLRQKFPQWRPKRDDIKLICQSAVDWECRLRQSSL